MSTNDLQSKCISRWCASLCECAHNRFPKVNSTTQAPILDQFHTTRRFSHPISPKQDDPITRYTEIIRHAGPSKCASVIMRCDTILLIKEKWNPSIKGGSLIPLSSKCDGANLYREELRDGEGVTQQKVSSTDNHTNRQTHKRTDTYTHIHPRHNQDDHRRQMMLLSVM